MSSSNTLLSQLIKITEEYLGPSAERFVYRQISAHLNKDPESLKLYDLHQLNDWLRVSLAFITEDSQILDQYEERLNTLMHRSKKESRQNASSK